MPISCTCPSCSAQFNVKDEYAGKRAKCPKCGEPITIPSAFHAGDTVKMPPPAAKTTTRPVAKLQPVEAEEEEIAPKTAKKPRVVGDEDSTPKGKRRDVDEEDASRGKKRRATEDEGEERPKKKRRRDDEPKKGSNLPLLLGIGMLVLLVLVGGGVITAVAMSKANEQANPTQPVADPPTTSRSPFPPVDQQPFPPIDQPSPSSPTVTRENFAKLRAGMTLQQVEAVMGKGREATSVDFQFTSPYYPAPDDGKNAISRWSIPIASKHVLIWNKAPERILVAFDRYPETGTVAGVVGVFQPPGEKYLVANETVRLAGKAEGPPNALLKTENIYGKLNRGDTLERVEKQIGKGQKADLPTVTSDVAKLTVSDAVKKRWAEYAEKGYVFRWDNLADRVLICFDGPSDTGGGVAAIVLTFGGDTTHIFNPPEGKIVDANDPGPTPSNLAKLKAGMTAAEVEKMLGGKGVKPMKADVTIAMIGLTDPREAADRWVAKNEVGHVLYWREKQNTIVVAFSDDPAKGGKVVGLVGLFRGRGSEPLKLGGGDGPKGEEPKPVALLTTGNLVFAGAGYKGKRVLVTGTATTGMTDATEWGKLRIGAGGIPVLFEGKVGTSGQPAKVTVGDDVRVLGTVAGYSKELKGMLMTDCVLVRAAPPPPVDPKEATVEVSAADLAEEFAKDPAAAITKYDGKLLKVKGKVNSRANDGGDVVLVGGNDGTTSFVQFRFEPADKAAAKAVAPASSVVIVGRVESYTNDGRNTVGLKDGKVEK